MRPAPGAAATRWPGPSQLQASLSVGKGRLLRLQTPGSDLWSSPGDCPDRASSCPGQPPRLTVAPRMGVEVWVGWGVGDGTARAGGPQVSKLGWCLSAGRAGEAALPSALRIEACFSCPSKTVQGHLAQLHLSSPTLKREWEGWQGNQPEGSLSSLAAVKLFARIAVYEWGLGWVQGKFSAFLSLLLAPRLPWRLSPGQ